MATPVIVWLRRDLRLQDNPALKAACELGAPVVPVFVWAPEEQGTYAPGAASRWWLHHALEDVQMAFRERGVELVLRQGPPAEVLPALCRETGAMQVFWNTVHEPWEQEAEKAAERALVDAGLGAKSFPGNLLYEPGKIRNSSGKPYLVYTAFWRHCQQVRPPPPVRVPLTDLRGLSQPPRTATLTSLGLLPKVRWDAKLADAWVPTRRAAERALDTFVKTGLATYAHDRDMLARDGTSRLSPYLHWGQMGVREVAAAAGGQTPGATRFLEELGWREFAAYTLTHFPQMPERPLREPFSRFPWEPDAALLEAWKRGRTGYPVVDAAMRQLWETGWMHNRARMIVASFLVKHLLQPWQEGEHWFWDTLVDADAANNALGWQWSAGCGVDAAPYFRIFNPTLQGQRFDPDGGYVRRFVPELAALPAAYVHQPSKAPAAVLAEAGVRLGETYPRPIVAHEVARRRALQAFEKLKAL